VACVTYCESSQPPFPPVLVLPEPPLVAPADDVWHPHPTVMFVEHVVPPPLVGVHELVTVMDGPQFQPPLDWPALKTGSLRRGKSA
jgi:hypothetical protein